MILVILREIFTFKFKINIILPQLLCFVVIVPLNSEYLRFQGFSDAIVQSIASLNPGNRSHYKRSLCLCGLPVRLQPASAHVERDTVGN